MNEFWIIITASIVAINSGIIGSFLVLRKMSMMGDAISHAVLPGIVIAYYLSGDKTSGFLLLGAVVTGVLATFLIDFLSKKARIQGDASLGITYTFLFALGMILIASWMNGNVDLDLECVLYGEIAYINMDKVVVDGNLYIGPYAFYTELAALIIIGSGVLVGFKGFKLLSFNEDYGRSLGVNMTTWHYALMALVSLTTVVAFEIVGAILVVGFLIIPAATAQLVSGKIKWVIALSCFFGVVSAVLGFFLAKFLNVSIAGTMVSVAGLIFFALLFFQQIKGQKVNR